MTAMNLDVAHSETSMKEIYNRINQILPTMHGWCTTEKGRRLAEIILETCPKKVVELGVFGGKSLISLALGAKQVGATVDGIDPYTAAASLDHDPDPVNDAWWAKVDYELILRCAQQAIVDHGLAGTARVIRATSAAAASSYENGSIGVLHQDSNHSEKQSTKEVELWEPKISAAGVWIMDDIGWHRIGASGEVIHTMVRAQEMLAERGFVLAEPHEEWAVFRRKVKR